MLLTSYKRRTQSGGCWWCRGEGRKFDQGEGEGEGLVEGEGEGEESQVRLGQIRLG